MCKEEKVNQLYHWMYWLIKGQVEEMEAIQKNIIFGHANGVAVTNPQNLVVLFLIFYSRRM